MGKSQQETTLNQNKINNGMKERKGVNISSIASLVSSLALLGMFFLPWIHAGRRIP